MKAMLVTASDAPRAEVGRWLEWSDHVAATRVARARPECLESDIVD
ncbi:MAG: hypothetical protein ACYDAG_05405 [Chloroflexota bacterium]